MQRTFFVVLAAAVALLIGAALPNFGTAQASSVLTPSAERAAVVVLAGSVNVAPVTTQTREGFIRETNSSQASQVLSKLGSTALWTYNPVLREFQPLATTTPKVGSAIYVRPSVGATLQTLSNPSWAAAITANPKEQTPATYKKDRQHPALGKPAFKPSKTATSKSAVKSSKVTSKVTSAVHKTTTVATTEKSTVVVTTQKTATTKAATPVKKSETNATVKKTTTKPPVKKTKTTKPITQTTTPATTVPSTTVAPAPTVAAAGTLSAPVGYAASQLEFSDTASQTAINPAFWNTYLTAAGSGNVPWNSNGAGGSSPAASSPDYDAEYDLPGQVSEANGVIDIRATETSTAGDLGGSPYTYPFASGVLSSYGKFEFTGGYVQIEAKMPGGAGMWPGLWMLPGSGATGISAGNTYEIDIFEGGGLDGPAGSSTADIFAWHLHTPNGVYGANTNSNVNLTTSFNTYGLKWVPGQSLTWYLNGNVIGSLTSAQATIPTVPMELIMNLQVANSNTSSWHSVYNSSTPTVNDMLISGVQVYS
jgi:beta-glucanase (GH16 family)